VGDSRVDASLEPDAETTEKRKEGKF